MAYADQKMSGNKVTALIIVALIHVVLGYLLVTGLAYSAVQKAIEKVTTVDIKEPEKPKEPPPPPPEQKQAPPPAVAPPVKINVSTTPPPITTAVTPPPYVAPIILAPPAPVPPPPAAPKGPTAAAQPRGDPQGWISTEDYPARSLREEKEGVTRLTLSVGADGRVTGCNITGSSGTPELDTTACNVISRRARFKPALQAGEAVASSYSRSVRWQIPKN